MLLLFAFRDKETEAQNLCSYLIFHPIMRYFQDLQNNALLKSKRGQNDHPLKKKSCSLGLNGEVMQELLLRDHVIGQSGKDKAISQHVSTALLQPFHRHST